MALVMKLYVCSLSHLISRTEAYGEPIITQCHCADHYHEVVLQIHTVYDILRRNFPVVGAVIVPIT
jgi:hypothetical protein